MSVDNPDEDQEGQVTPPDLFDEQFASIIADLGRSTEPPGFHAEQSLSDYLDGGDLDNQTPNNDADIFQKKRACVGLVLSPISSSQGLHALLSVAGIKEWVVRIKPWTAIWMTLDNTGRLSAEEEMASLLGESRSIPPAIDRAARIASKTSQFGAVAMASFLVDGDHDGLEPGTSGQIIARRYVGGQPEDSIPAGVLVGSMPILLEDLLLGRTTPDQYDGSVSPDGNIAGTPKGFFGWMKK